MLSNVLRESGQPASSSFSKLRRPLPSTPQLTQIGFELSPDDFGAGNKSFAFLRHLRVDIFNADKSCVQRVGADLTPRYPWRPWQK